MEFWKPLLLLVIVCMAIFMVARIKVSKEAARCSDRKIAESKWRKSSWFSRKIWEAAMFRICDAYAKKHASTCTDLRVANEEYELIQRFVLGGGMWARSFCRGLGLWRAAINRIELNLTIEINDCTTQEAIFVIHQRHYLWSKYPDMRKMGERKWLELSLSEAKEASKCSDVKIARRALETTFPKCKKARRVWSRAIYRLSTPLDCDNFKIAKKKWLSAEPDSIKKAEWHLAVVRLIVREELQAK